MRMLELMIILVVGFVILILCIEFLLNVEVFGFGRLMMNLEYGFS